MHDLAQLGDIGRRLFGAANVGAADDFHQRNAGAVEIHKGVVGIHIMHRFAGILLQVNAFNAHQTRCSISQFDEDFALSHNRVIQLADLIALWQVGVEVVFPIKG